ncbi:formyltetrahydrofolate deformylase [Conexibacter woesei]|uniref:Formyltetrahydrofolate deformylase n=1 Tax=Conexibacter woesei (strain DSM 14684 / CCUG 47730 / CIP 108061 / JCM 11494 / NBRC 100937 / ID131577) TaxID=469383 RepID=D3F146_CONWI|nr:formyltetrahydrofolate deformylase [Conexibacter woesei]ADB50122.1 formyltetrahydrofolate deformylase [Conexibacter woesei DSM 14684]
MDRSDQNATNAGRLNIARLLISCSDQPGIVAAVSRFLFEHGANILDADQHTTDPEGGVFFMRMEFQLDGLDLGRGELEQAFGATVGEPFGMDWRLSYANRRKRVALLVSREEHCLLDLLWRWRSGDLDADVGLVVSNHRDAERDVESFGVPFLHVPVAKESKPQAEAEILRHLRGFDLVVLARYMQILSGDFLAALDTPMINIHHSFLPAFAGADPYRRASERGVKIIGATAHYVTEELDAGPIIEQDVARVSHRDSLEELVRIGRDIERIVLARAVSRHLADRVLVHENRTVVF